MTIDHTDADASFLLPNLLDLPDDIRIRVTDSLVDTTTMNTLEENSSLTSSFSSFDLTNVHFHFQNVSIGG